MKRESQKRATEALGTQQVIIETPRGSRNKYKFDEKTGGMKLSKVMPEGMMFPYDFGFIPGTKAEDGDPLEVLAVKHVGWLPSHRRV